jgi:N-acetylmuramoyl-L-alanine amidase CwlA
LARFWRTCKYKARWSIAKGWIWKNHNTDYSNNFEKVKGKNCGDPLVQIVLDVEQVIDYNLNHLQLHL